MGHKVHPKTYRLQVTETWDSRWFSKSDYSRYAKEDILIRAYLAKQFREAHIDAISIERGPKQLVITILAAKPGYIIGRGGKGLDDVRRHIEHKILSLRVRAKINVREVASPALSAPIVAQTVAEEIQRRLPFRRVMKQTMKRVMDAGARGFKIQLSGRLNGVEIARTEKLSAGTLPLITLRSDVDYAGLKAQTTYGAIGVKIWICHGERFGRKDRFSAEKSEEKTAHASASRHREKDRHEEKSDVKKSLKKEPAVSRRARI